MLLQFSSAFFSIQHGSSPERLGRGSKERKPRQEIEETMLMR
jgi:hypothetical protein